ncbi:MAG: tetratricopeptide repeat protein, partial [Gallionellaceae bacterium]
PVHFLRYVPGAKSRVGEIYYDRIPSSNSTDTWTDREVRKVAATRLTPAFTVTTRDQAIQPKLLVEFASAINFSISPGADNRSFVITMKPLASAAPRISNKSLPLLPTVLPPVIDNTGATTAENNNLAYKLMLAGRDALSAKDYPAATHAFNKLLLLPPNQYSQDAQEWVGVARERDGQIAKAKAEYELYLKLYTSEPGVSRVKQRLAGLAAPVAKARMGAASRTIKPRSFVQGGVSSHYYFGQSNLDTTYQWNNTSQTTSYAFKDQSSLISNVDAIARYVNDEYDNRIVLRDINTKNFLPGQVDRNRINSAYIEVKNRKADYSARLGRQTTGGGGVMGRFDGLSASYGSIRDFRVNAVAGQLVDFTNYTQPVFYGMSVDMGPVSVYLLNQTLDGVLDRRALGSEFRYFEGKQTAYAALDYDIYFNVLNSATFNGSMGVASTGTTYNFVADFRKSPSISTRNALNGASTTSIADLQAAMTEAELKQLALDRTGSSSFAQFGATQKLDSTWQLGGDIKLTQTAGLPASGTTALQGIMVATPDTGLEKTITAQLIGSNLYSDADITSMGASYITSSYVQNGQSVFVYNRTSWDRELYFDTSWNYYAQTDTYGGGMARNMPMVRVTYQVAQRMSLDADLGAELTTYSGPYQSSTNTRIFGSMGFRWDF